MIVVLILFCLFFGKTVDLWVFSLCHGETGFIHNTLTQWLYHWGERLGFIFGIVSAFLFLASYRYAVLTPWKKRTAVIGITLLMGAGFCINGVVKECWGRPRPRHLISQHQPYKAIYQPSLWATPHYKSFPSGHVAMGVIYFVLYYIGKKEKNRALVWLGWIIGIGFGGAVAFARVVEGAHFITDAVGAFIIMALTMRGAVYLVYTRHLIRWCESPIQRLLPFSWKESLILES